MVIGFRFQKALTIPGETFNAELEKVMPQLAAES
jgi:hypothetical protein